MFVQISRRLVATVVMFMVAAMSAPGALRAQEQLAVSDEVRSSLREHQQAAVEWLVEQVVPNETVPDPNPARRNLIVSYRIPPEDPVYPYLYGRSFVYDGAVAAIAFTMSGRYREAQRVLLGLARQVRGDGSVWFGLNTQNAWPSEADSEGAVVRSGASAWVGYAATFYLRARLSADPEFEVTGNAARRIQMLAVLVADRLLELQIDDPGDRRHGLVTGGFGTYSFSVDDSDEIVAAYDRSPVGWASTEHNIDAYYLFRDLAELTGDDRYTRAADLVRAGLLSLWSEDDGQFYQGVKVDGRVDTVLPLDTASWGSLFLGSVGERARSDRALASAQRRFRLGDSDHYRPYADDAVFESPAVSRVVFGDADTRWNDVEIAWIEGSQGVASALVQAGLYREAVDTMLAALDYQVDGGFRYASVEIPELFSTFPSVASTGWFVIATELLLDESDRGLFWGAR
ncbi:MAG: hypothetical protein PF508_20020 [Spirochaeta sp.]|nr:hypothetical protein [Spirochaeta sp.]